jgi:hypothetical protein
MKSILLAAVLLPSILIAQIPQPMPMRQMVQRGIPAPTDALPDNYQVTLTITDKDGQPIEVSVVVASTRFNASLGDQHLTFEGAVAVEDSGIVIAYALGWETLSPPAEGNIQSRNSSMQGSVRLKLGEEVQIIRAGTRVARLSIKKLEPSKPK